MKKSDRSFQARGFHLRLLQQSSQFGDLGVLEEPNYSPHYSIVTGLLKNPDNLAPRDVVDLLVGLLKFLLCMRFQQVVPLWWSNC